MSTATIVLPVPSRRTLLLVITVMLLMAGLVWAVTAYAASVTASQAGVVTVAKGKKTVVVPTGMDLTAQSKAQATAMTASTVGVRSVVPNVANDTLTITLTGKAKKPIAVSWAVTNGTRPADTVDITALELRVAELESTRATSTDASALAARVTQLEADRKALQDRVAALEATLTGVSRVDFQGQPTIRFAGVNVQVVDGQDESTRGPVNGRGNLIVGWNEVDAEDLRTGSHNLVVGAYHTYASSGGLVAGYDNQIIGFAASVTGGLSNIASGDAASVTGGQFNEAIGRLAVVTGGRLNAASGAHSTIAGGFSNFAHGEFSAIAGGYSNQTVDGPGLYTTVAGGSENVASGTAASVAGGYRNISNGEVSSVVGGDDVGCPNGWRVVCGEGTLQNTGDN